MKPIIPKANLNISLVPNIKKALLLFLFIFLQWFIQPLYAQEHNRVDTFTTANGLASLGCSDVLREPDGTVWVTHKDYYQAPFSYGFPISRRSPNGTWDYPSLSGTPSFTVGGNTYPIAFRFDKMFRSSDGKIWFLSGTSVPVNNDDGNLAPPIVEYNNGVFSVYHASLNNFPNKGGVIDMAEDGNGNLWFACAAGLVKMSNAGIFTTYDPPNVQYTDNAGNVNIPAKRVISIDVDNNNNIVMVVDGQFNYVRRYRPLDNQWDLWTLMDAPWVNAGQTTYSPLEIKASGDKDNTIWITTFGGGLYYIKNNDYNSNERTQIANFLVPPIWGTWGWAMDIIRTNIPDFCSRMFMDSENKFWIIGSPGSTGIHNAYRFERKVPTTYLYNGQNVPATRYIYANRSTQFTFNNNGNTTTSSITGLSFASDNSETWVATRHGVERWYSSYPFPDTGSIIGIQGAGNKKIGIAAFNTLTNNVLEPAATAHNLVPGIPTNSIDTAYYYLSTSDYEGIDNTTNAGLRGDGFVRGFPALSAALQTHNYTTENLHIKFTPVSLGNDIKGTGEDWNYQLSTETRKYQKRIEVYNDETSSEIKSHYEIYLNGTILFKGEMPVVHLGIGYNKYGYLADSIAAHTDDVRLIRYPFITQQDATDIANAIEQDLNGHGVKFIFQSIQSANDTSIRTNDRIGGFFKVNYSYLKKSDTVMANITPLAGIYRIGNSMQAHFPTVTDAVNALHTNGVSSWVNFLIEDGVYNEQFAISPIAGTQEWNNRPIRFRSLSKDSTKVMLQFAPANSNTNYIFRHNGTKKLSFEKVYFKNTAATFGRAIHINAPAASFSLLNCIVEGNEAAPANVDNDLVYNTGSFNEATINNSVFINGNRALHLLGNRIKVINNEFYGHKNYAVSFGNNTDAPEVSSNRIYGSSTGTFSGISMGSATNGFIVQQNKIINTQVPGIAGISCTFSAAGGSYITDNAKVWNNEISMLSGANTVGIVAQSVYTSFYHNTVHLTGNNASSTAVRAGLSQGNTKIENNIFSNPNGFAMIVWRSPSNYYPESNRNIYHGGVIPFKIHTNTNVFTNYATVAALSAASNRDAASIEADPQFLSDEELIPQNASVYNLANNISGLTTDIRNKTRPANNRDHGAYEFNAWSGAFNNSWSQAANWTDGIVPDENGMALFPSAGVTHELVITQPRSIHTMSVAETRNITVNNNQQLNITGSLHNNGFIGGSGNVVCNEGEQQRLSGTGSIRNLIINNSNGVRIAAGNKNAVGIAESVEIQNGTLITNDNLVLKSSPAVTARLKPLTTGNISGKVTVERYIPAKRAWRTLTAPLKGNENNSIFYNWQNNDSIIVGKGVEIWANIGTADPSSQNNGIALGGGHSIRKWNNGWGNILNTNTAPLFNEQGNNAYLLFVTGSYNNGNGNIANGADATVLAAKGNLITGTHSIENLTNNQFHLIGNPYPSTIDFTQVQKNNIQNRFWLWDPNATGANNSGAYILFDAATNITVPATPVGSYNNYTSLIQSGQAFFVYADGGNGNLQFEESHKASSSTASVFRTNNGGFEKMKVSLYRHINNTAQFSDGITALFDNNGDTAVNSHDAFKMFNPADNIAFIRAEKSLMLERRPLIDDKDTLFIHLSQTVAATYELRLQGTDFDVAANLTAELIDNYLNTNTPVNLDGETIYTFSINADAASTGNRFIIVFKSNNVLPLHTLHLKAEQQQRTVQLQWNVTGEYDMDKYAVEKSTDGISFKETHQTPAYNISSEVQYKWTDNKPAVSTNYYRIKAINKDGSYKYSNIEKIQFTTFKSQLFIYPNPSSSIIFLQLPQPLNNNNYTLRIIDYTGKTIIQQKFSEEKIQLNIDRLSKGIYIVEIIDLYGNKSTEKLIKN